MCANDNSPPLSPCDGTCRMDAHGYCVGCRRTLDEIVRWSQLDNARRRQIMQDVLPTRRPTP